MVEVDRTKDSVDQGKELMKKKLEDNFSFKMKQIQEDFPKQFIRTLLKGKDPKLTKAQLVGLIFDTIFLLICDVISLSKEEVLRQENEDVGVIR